MSFAFSVDEQSADFCALIVSRMGELFGITREEAIARINRRWKAKKLIGPECIIYHEDADFWAKTLYYKIGTKWWQASSPLESEEL